MKGSFHITYEWWVTETPDDSVDPTEIHNQDIHPEHVDQLHTLARDRAIEMIADHYRCGELLAGLLESEDGSFSYRGWWDLQNAGEADGEDEDETLAEIRWGALEIAS